MMKIAIALIVLGLLLCAIGIATGVLGRRRRKPRRPAAESLGSGDQTPSNPKLNTAPAVNIENAASTSQPRAAAAAGGAAAARRQRRDEHGRLVFIQEGRTRFEIEDLLRASAEVLGSGTFGSSYKATLCEGPAVVVKRFKDMNGVGREDFSEHMRRLGRLAHARATAQRIHALYRWSAAASTKSTVGCSALVSAETMEAAAGLGTLTANTGGLGCTLGSPAR